MKGESKRLRIAIASILSGAAVSWAGVAVAASDRSSDTLEEIVVTSRKRVENLQDVPQSIDVFSKAEIEKLAISQFEDYATRSPSISWISIGPGTQSFIMRGVSDGSNPNYPNTSTTGMYLDELSLSYYGGIPDLHMYDIERIEVLNGPQGTLYGASSMSGAVRIVTNKPDPSEFSGGFDFDGGSIDGGEHNEIFEGFVNIPLVKDMSAIRVVGFYDRQGGFINNLLTTRQWVNGVTSTNAAYAGNNYNRQTISGGRVEFLQKFNEAWKFNVSGEIQHQAVHGAWDENPSVNGPRNVARFGPESGERYNRLLSGTLEGDVGIGDLIYAAGYWNRTALTFDEYSEYVQYASSVIGQPVQPYAPGNTYPSYSDFIQGFACATSPTDGGAYSGCNNPYQYIAYKEHTDYWSQEVRLQSKPGGSTHWIVGGFWEKLRDFSGDIFAMPGIQFQGQQASAWIDYYGGTPLPQEWYGYQSRSDQKQVAAFGELTQDFGKQWSVTVGLRQSKSDFSDSSAYAGFFYSPMTPQPLQAGSSHKLTYRASVQFKAAENLLFYGSAAQGFRDGGFNVGFVGNALVPQSYTPDTVNSYELGWKTEYGNRFKWNGAVYWMDWKDYQTSVYDPQISLSGSFNANIGNARIYGAESNVEVSPTKGLSLSVSASYNDSRLTSNTFANPDFLVLPGQRLPFVPYLKGSATARYEHNLGPDYLGYAQVDFSHNGDMWSDLRADNRFLQPAYNLTTLRFGYNTTKTNWGVEGYISNLDNTRAVVYVNTYNYDHRHTTIEPRVFGVRIKYRFGGKAGAED